MPPASLTMAASVAPSAQAEATRRLMRTMESSPVNFKVSLADQLKLMKATDVSLADNYWEGTLPRTRRNRQEAARGKDTMERIKVDETYYALMNTGFDRRMTGTKRGQSAVAEAARMTSFKLELGKSKEEQLADMKKRKVEERTGVMRVVPQGLHKFVDYINSLYKKPAQAELTKNVLIGAFFAFVVWVNQGARSAFMYYVIGNLATMSSLLTRNMPKVNVAPGMDKRKVATWSSNAFKTAVAMTLACTLGTAFTTLLLTAVLPLSLDAKLKAAMIASSLSSAYFTSFYEVFEEKSKNGWRWAKAQEGMLPADMEARLAQEASGIAGKNGDMYDYNYDPQVDDYPPQPKYVDEVRGPGGGDAATAAGELDEGESKEHFEKWRQFRKDSRRPPVEDAPPETPWVGGKAGMYVSNVPTWLSTAYKANVLKANKWRDKPARFIKDSSEFELIPGPFGFRDKCPEWFDLFGTGVWEEKITTSRKAARAFGSYRKTMWKIDKKVVLLPCDGADKDTHAVDKKKP